MHHSLTFVSIFFRTSLPTVQPLLRHIQDIYQTPPLRRIRCIAHNLAMVLGDLRLPHVLNPASIASVVIAFCPVADEIRIAAQLGAAASALSRALAGTTGGIPYFRNMEGIRAKGEERKRKRKTNTIPQPPHFLLRLWSSYMR